MITNGQARRLARTYSIEPNIARQVDISGTVPLGVTRSQFEQEIAALADRFPDQHGVFADARAWADWCVANRGYVQNWHSILEDSRNVGWNYRTGD